MVLVMIQGHGLTFTINALDIPYLILNVCRYSCRPANTNISWTYINYQLRTALLNSDFCSAIYVRTVTVKG
jgi:hypothetical protein